MPLFLKRVSFDLKCAAASQAARQTAKGSRERRKRHWPCWGRGQGLNGRVAADLLRFCNALAGISRRNFNE